MKLKRIGLIAVIVIAAAIIGYKTRLSPAIQTAAAAAPPRVLLAAVLREANIPGDGCSELIHIVRSAGKRGIAVQEIDANSKSKLLARYHIIAFPTVLIFSKNGKETARYVGEGPDTIKAVRAAVEKLE